MLSQALLTELQTIMREEYDMVLTLEEVKALGEFLVATYDILLDAEIPVTSDALES